MTSNLKIRYKVNEKGLDCSVSVNGHEISDKISNLNLRMSADGFPYVVFEVPVNEVEVDADGAITKGIDLDEE